jgi:prolipoprotein diacylglyceryltransferase
VAFVVPFGWAIGRIACSLAHDHPGYITRCPLAISLRTPRAQDFIARVYGEAGLTLPGRPELAHLGFHDLGWYEFLYLALFVCPLFVWLNRRDPAVGRRPGFWISTIVLCYAPMRLLLDTLRIADVRYLGLTPGQYAAATLLTVPAFIAIRKPGVARA